MPVKGTVKSIAKNAEDSILEDDKSDRPLPDRPLPNRPHLNRPLPREGISSGLYKNLNDDEAGDDVEKNEWKLTTVKTQERNTWSSDVRSIMCAASQLPRVGPTDMDDARKSKT